MAKRRGFTLIEAIVVIGMMAVLMTMSATTIFHLLEMEGHGNRALVVSTTLSRLASDFRRDVHAAKKGTGPFSSKKDRSPFLTVRLEMPDGRVVEYHGGPDRVVRQISTAAERGSGRDLSTETYVLPESMNQFEASSDQTLLSLVHSRLVRLPGGQKPIGAAERSFRIEAVVSRDHRFGRDAQ